MASATTINGVAKMFLAPNLIGSTEAMLEDLHQTRAKAEDYVGALEVGQLLIEVRKLHVKLDAKSLVSAAETEKQAKAKK